MVYNVDDDVAGIICEALNPGASYPPQATAATTQTYA
jgi:hypothetical protein